MRSKGRTHGPLAELAKKQHGVVSLGQLEGLGYSQHSVGRAVRSGRLHRLHRGVYAVGHLSLAWEGRCLAAVLACGPSAVASHASAAWLWGLLRTRPDTLHVTVSKRRSQRAAFRLHFSSLAEEDRSVCEGIPLTALPRTLLDLAATFEPRRLERAIERSEELRLFDLHAVDALLARSAGHPGAGRLRKALAIYRDDPAFTRSRLETRFLDLVKAAGLPVPAMNFSEGSSSWMPIGNGSASRLSSMSTRLTGPGLRSSATGCAKRISSCGGSR